MRHLVELHDGAVRAESAGRGRGAVFTVELPALGSPVLDDGRRLVNVLPPGQERFTNRS